MCLTATLDWKKKKNETQLILTLILINLSVDAATVLSCKLNPDTHPLTPLSLECFLQCPNNFYAKDGLFCHVKNTMNRLISQYHNGDRVMSLSVIESEQENMPRQQNYFVSSVDMGRVVQIGF